MSNKIKYFSIFMGCITIFGFFIFISYLAFNNISVAKSQNSLAINEVSDTITNQSDLSIILSSANKIDEDYYSEEEKIESTTQITYKYNFEEDGSVETNTVVVPYFLVGMNQQEFEEEFYDWELNSFSSKEIVVSKDIYDNSQDYIVGNKDGYVTIFYSDENQEHSVKQETQTPVDTLSEEEQEKINQGIPIKGDEQLSRALESYGS